MNRQYNPYLTEYSRKLRSDMTKEERKLWYDFLRKLPVRFRRQVPFGKYIVDFYCSSRKLAIELDGSQHYENDEMRTTDAERDDYLLKQGIATVRYPNNYINRNFEWVCGDIILRLGLNSNKR